MSELASEGERGTGNLAGRQADARHKVPYSEGPMV